MILPDYLEKELIKFCKLKNIAIRDGKILRQSDVNDVKDFINQRLKKDRQATRRKEEEKKLKIKPLLDKFLKDLKPTPIEEYMAEALVEANLYKHCRPQFQIGKCQVDFAFPIAHLAVECDGRAYHHTEVWQLERDQKRDKYLARKGYRVLHIEGLAIRRNIGLCIDKIKEALKPFIPELKGV